MANFLSTTLTLASFVCGGQESESQELQPDPKLLAKLADRVEVDDVYSLQPPNGYRQVMPERTPPGMKLMAWVGKPRDDGTSAMVQIMIVEPPEGEAIKSPEQAMESMIGGVKRQRHDWSQTDPEPVKINGIDFLRVEWTGTVPQLGKMHGRMYVAVDGRAHISIHTQDVEDHAGALAIGEAAALTFKKK